jgi:hypothetical protein
MRALTANMIRGLRDEFRPSHASPTVVSYLNQVVADTIQWEQSAAFRLEIVARRELVRVTRKTTCLV